MHKCCIWKVSKLIVSTAFRLWAMTRHRNPKVPSSIFKRSFSNWRILLTISCVSVNTPGPPFPPESFDRVLLDAPCSGLGQRPNMSCTMSLKEICSYMPLQRKLFRAVGFYSTLIKHVFIFCFTDIALTHWQCVISACRWQHRSGSNIKSFFLGEQFITADPPYS